uniref:ATPase AAA-type core domain-containing protein n=1 Tax=Anopheles farauti TaxID=69004 RepID=A0A182QAV4_9DIPT
MAPTMAAEPSTNVCLNHKVRKTESVASSSSSSSESGLSSASGKALLTLSKPELDRLIAENMTSVLKTLKKRKHAKKHARLRQAAVEEAVPEDGDTMAGKEEHKASTTSEERSVARKEKKDTNSHKASKPKQKTQTQANGVAEAGKKSTMHSLKEVQPDAKNESTVATNTTTGGDANCTLPAEKLGKENKTINAFQLMMTARSKCIGSNSPGRELEARELSPSQQQEREKKAKRNLQLQEWAEKKGSAKRRLQEEAEDEYIDNQLKKRAKRLKKLIGNLSAELEETTPDTQQKQHELKVLDAPDEPINESNKPVSRKGKSVDSPATPRGTLLEEIKPSGRKARGRPTKNALPPAVETPEPEPVAQAENVSTDPFLEQLSSPRKKKDSLLGYFAKLTPETRKPNDSPTTTKRKKHPTPPSTANSTVAPGAIVTITDDDDDDNDGEKNIIGTPPSTGRPKRSCANRIKDYSAFESYSPAKEEQKPPTKKPPIVTPLKIINVQSPNAMKVVKSPSMRMFASSGAVDGASIKNGKAPSANEYPTTPKSVKLAPLFVRSGKPPPPDPEKARARHLFLMSGMPEKMRQEIEKRAAYEDFVLNESPVFPLVSHVRQEEALSVQQAATNFNRSCIKVRPAACGESSPVTSIKGGKSRKIRYGMFTECSMYDYEDALDRCVEPIELEAEEVERNGTELPEVQNVTDIVRDYKQRYPHFPVFRCYKQFRAIYKEHQQQQQQLMRQCGEEAIKATESDGIFQADESIEIIEPTLGFRNGEMLFTEKYKPQDTKQILINFPPANLLSQFLSLWQQPSQQAQDEGGSRRCHGDYFFSNGDDDFELSNGSSASVSSTTAGSGICNHIVLVGPPGCGKTCNVYAVANELNFNVLEINASSRRKGKIILQELLEATQSHLVRQKPKERSNSTDGFLQNGGGTRPKGVAGKKNGLTSAVFRCLERRSSFSETNGTSGAKKLSLILIEDADIVFEQDDGFLGAINQLIATSKRPIVLTTTNPSCAHMARYMTRNNVIQYVAPGIGNVAKLLSLLALVERIPIDQHDLGRLYAYNRKDMRKTLNELQFFVQSGGDMPRFSERCGQDQEFRALALETASDNDPLNQTREDEEGEQMDEKRSQTAASKGRAGRKKTPADPEWLRKQHHVTLYDLFTRNQNEQMVLHIPLDFNALWCNMELVLRMAQDVTSTPSAVVSRAKKPKALTPSGTGKRGKRGSSATVRQPSCSPKSPPDVVLCEKLSFLYENISRAEAGWGMTQRNRIRYGKDIQDEQQQQQLANELGHALVEGSWIDWFSRRRDGDEQQQKMQKGAAAGVAYGTVKAYDALRKLEQEPRQTIASYIGVSGVRSRVTACDYEPMLRQICRHERDRSSLERRGSRFYHYLRNFTPLSGVSSSLQQHQQTLPFLTPMGPKPAGNGFSVDHFDALSHCLEERSVATVAASPENPEHGPTD